MFCCLLLFVSIGVLEYGPIRFAAMVWRLALVVRACVAVDARQEGVSNYCGVPLGKCTVLRFRFIHLYRGELDVHNLIWSGVLLVSFLSSSD